MKHKYFALRVVALLGVFFLFIIFSICFAGALSDIRWYSDALDESVDILHNSDSIEVIQVEGKEPLKSETVFDQNCYINQRYSYQSGTEWVGAAKALYDNTGLQLYNLVLTAPMGNTTDINNASDAKHYSLEYIKDLPNYDTAIVLWEFYSEDTDDNYISIYDNVTFGNSALTYIGVEDMEMIEYILDHDYDLFPDYETRTIREWETISNNIRNGYNRNLYNGSVNVVTDWDLNYYRESIQSAKISSAIFGALALISFIAFLILMWVDFILIPKRIKASIEVEKAKADRIILEADISKMPDAADELADKYLK